MANGYYGSIPQIAQAFQNDPRTRLANSALATGTSTAPVAGGGWAVPDGLARAAQAILGGVINKKQEEKYSKREQDYIDALKASSALASTPQPQAPMGGNPAVANPAAANPGTDAMASAAQALAPPTSSMQVPQAIPSFDPGASQVAQAPPISGPQGAFSGAGGGSGPARPQMAASGAENGRVPMSGNARDLYFRGIVPIEGGTDPKTGAFRTSPKGAIGPGQVMPGTAPEAAKLAGVEFNDRLYRTDPEYNNLLGQAYYAKQLEDFGDPVLAAAAYNAGPGRVRTALRRARRNGGEWTNYLPEETQGYVAKFTQRVGSASGSEINQDVAAVGATQVAPPQMEQVPGAPEVPTQAPNMPDVPPEVQSNRIAIAQQMLESGNPDLVALAQAYLDQGLTEQNEARTLRSEQQYGRQDRAYSAELNDYTDARSQGRSDAYNRRRDAEGRNFDRETMYRDQSFTAGENAADREQRAREASADRFWRSNEAATQREWEGEQSAADRAAEAAGGRNPFLDTAAGMKLREEMRTKISEYDKGISDLNQFLQLMEQQSTGGVYGIPGVGGVAQTVVGGFDKELNDMAAIANRTALKELGGSLGVAISDGDRNFVVNSTINLGNSSAANRNIGTATIAAFERAKDYEYNKMYAEANGLNPAQFDKTWRMFAESNPIVHRDNKGNVIRIAEPVTFEEWVASRPRYDANGNKVN